MKIILFFFFVFVFLLPAPLIYAPPEFIPEDAFRYSDYVVTGKIISSEIIKDPRNDNSASTFYDTIVYDVQVAEWHKNRLDNNTITVYGKHYPNDVVPEPNWGVVEFELGSIVYLYLDQTEQGLHFREYGSKLLPDSDLEPLPPCKSGPVPEGDYVFFDCNWVKVPHGWIFENDTWQEDPAIQRLGPEPLPTCPRIGICTCSGDTSYYDAAYDRCVSSPYMPEHNQKLCKEYEQIKLGGWQFNSKYCDWIPLSDPYENEESMRLASEKVGLGGLGIDPEIDLTTMIVGIATAVGIASGLLLYWRRR